MASYNKVILLGNLTRDPELSFLPNQTPVVNFGMASNRKWNAQDGTKREEVCFVDCRAFGKLAETINQYCKKGRSLLIDGRLTFDQWEDKDGTKRNKHRILVESMQFVGEKPNNNEQAADDDRDYVPSSPPAKTHGPKAEPMNDDDIPF